MERLGEDDGSEYFILLTSQLMQRLVKNVQKVSWTSLEFLVGFVEAMSAASNTVLTTEHDREAFKYVQAIISKASSPTLVKEAVPAFSKSSYLFENWMVQAFNLQNGKKILSFAEENADSRESQSQTIGAISAALTDLAAIDAQRDAADMIYDETVANKIKAAHKATQEKGRVLVLRVFKRSPD